MYKALTKDGSNGGEEEQVNPRNSWKMESMEPNGLVAGGVPRKIFKCLPACAARV